MYMYRCIYMYAHVYNRKSNTYMLYVPAWAAAERAPRARRRATPLPLVATRPQEAICDFGLQEFGSGVVGYGLGVMV